MKRRLLIKKNVTPVHGKQFPPAEGLNEIAYYWHATSNGKPRAHRHYLLISPDPHIEISFDFQDPQKTPVLVGLLSRTRRYLPNGAVDLMGVKFRPGGFYSLFGRPAYLFKDKYIPLSQAIGLRAAANFEPVFLANTAEDRARILDSIFQKFATRKKPINPRLLFALRVIANQKGLVTVQELAKLTGWTERWLHTMFNRWIGVNPRDFCANFKFYSLMINLSSLKSTNFSEAALDAGYCDQAHLNREFKKRMSITPSQMFGPKRRHSPLKNIARENY